MSFGAQNDIRRKNERQKTVVLFGVALAAFGLAGLVLHAACLTFGSLFSYVTTVDWTPWVFYSYYLCLAGVILLGIASHPQYFPLTESRIMSDEAAAMLQHCPEVRAFRDTVVASGRELCGEDHALMMKIYNHFVKFEDSVLPLDVKIRAVLNYGRQPAR